MQQVLSQSLAEILEERSTSGGITLNRLMERTEGRGLHLVIIILCLPFIVPLSIPGLSTLMGAIIFLLALRLSAGKCPRLPGFLGERQLPDSVRQRVLGGSVKFLRILEKLVRPRRTQWLSWRFAREVHRLLILVLALLLAMPLPSPPFFFSNSLPSYAIILLAASMMEKDGVLIWLGYLLVLANVAFFCMVGRLFTEALSHSWQAVVHFLSSL